MSTSVVKIFNEHAKLVLKHKALSDEKQAILKQLNDIESQLGSINTKINELMSQVGQGKSISDMYNAPKQSTTKLISADTDELPYANNAIPALVNDTDLLNGYNPRWSAKRKAEYIIRKTGKCMMASDVIDCIVFMEPELYRDRDARRALVPTVSGQFSRNIKNETTFNRYTGYDNNFYYGLREWFDENGNILPKYDPNKKASENSDAFKDEPPTGVR